MGAWLTLRLRKLLWPEGYRAMAMFMAVAVVIFFWDPLFTWSADAILAGGDTSRQFVPWLTFTFDSLRRYGELPLWNPYTFCGVPFSANPQSMLFYPFTYLGLWMPITRAIVLAVVIHTWLAGMGMYGWLRSLGATHAGAFLAGIAFAFSGAYLLRLGVGAYNSLLLWAWWPLSFWALHTAFDRRSWRGAILSSVPLAMAMLSGNASLMPLLYMTLAAYSVYEGIVAYGENRRWSAGLRVLELALVAVVTSVTLAAVQYAPLLTLAQLSTRASAPSLDFSARMSLPFEHLITLIVPNFFGEPIRMGLLDSESHYEITFYAGVLIFFLAIAGGRLIRRRRLLFFLVLVLGALIWQLGPDGTLFVLLYRFVPGISMIQGPGRAGFIYIFAAVTVAGLVWSELERASQDEVQHILGIFNKTFVWIFSTIVIGAVLVAFIVYATFQATGVAWTWHIASELVQFLVVFWATMALFAAWKNRSLAPRTLNVLAVLIVLFDLWAYGLKDVRSSSDPLAAFWSDIASFMQHTSDYRVAPEFDYEFFQNNGHLIQHIRSHFGYDPLKLARYQALLDSAPSYFDPIYDLLNIEYEVSRKPLVFQETGLRLEISFQKGDLIVYRRPNVLPRAFVVHEAQIIPGDEEALAALHAAGFEVGRTVTLPAAPPCSLEPAVPSVEETAQVVGESPNHLELKTRSEATGLLVLSEVEYPGWQASVDGQPTQVLRADTTLRAVCLPAGSHTVRFDFRPRDLVIGAIISCLALVVVMGAAVAGLISARQATRS